jgi:homoserine kinase
MPIRQYADTILYWLRATRSCILAPMSVSVQVPATTSNFGPGFDCLGAALQLWNRVIIDRADQEIPLPEIVAEAAELFFRHSGILPFPFRFMITGEVPRARGLGSSVTVRAGVLIALNHYLNQPLALEQICNLCTELEGHPDNAAAAIFGGFTIVNSAINRVDRFDIDPEIKFVLFIPDFEVKTSDARKVVPATYPREAVVQNLANVSRIAAAFASKRYDLLQDAFADRLHQPYREPLVPFLGKVLDAATKSGAIGGFLSGSGSTIACLTLSNGEKVAAAMLRSATEANAKVLIVSADNAGAKILPTPITE